MHLSSKSELPFTGPTFFYNILKLARTVADLAGEESISPNHLAEALQYRPKLALMG